MTQASVSLGQFLSTELDLLLTPGFLREWGSKVRTSPGDGVELHWKGFWKHRGLLSSENLCQGWASTSGSGTLDSLETGVFELRCCPVSSVLRGDVKGIFFGFPMLLVLGLWCGSNSHVAVHG